MSRDKQRERTRRELVHAALRLVENGHTPTVTEVADAADISRRTAYRYFPSADQLVTEAVLEGMRTQVEAEIDPASDDDDIDTRVDRLVDALHHLTVDKEHLLRQMIRFTIDRGPIAPGVPPRPTRRLEYVDKALSSLREQLTPSEYDRLLHAMSVVIGIEARIVLRDICGLDDDTILDTERWAAHALVAAALTTRAPAVGVPPKRRRPTPR